MKKAAGYYQMVSFLFQPPVRQNENKEHTSRSSSNMTPGFSFSDDSSDTSSFSSGSTQSANHIYIHGKLHKF